ncbi:MAG TPA: DUF2092 domain-containing protein [Stellaceae bacterium]|nr:DUF2092 domain-containing protein [Stellaceae bacterium]
MARSGRMRALALSLLLGFGVGAWTLLAVDADAQSSGTNPSSAKSGKSAKASKKPSGPTQMILEQRAMDLLKAVCDRLAAAKSMTFTAVVSYEHPSQLGPPILYTLRYDVTMQRPDKLKVVQPGDGPASEFYYDGKTMMAFAPAANLVAIADAPPTIQAALKAAYDNAAIYFPFTDLLVDDPYAMLTEGTILAFYIGPSGVVGGVKTEMVAWANKDVFLQVWIGADDKLPRRIRAIYSADPLALRNDMELSDWQLDPTIPPEAFVSERAKSAPRITFSHPAAGPSPGTKPLSSGPLGNNKSTKTGSKSAPKQQ